LAPFIGKVLGVKPVHIDFQAKGKQRSLNMPGIGGMDITALEGAGGRDIIVENHPLSAVPNQPAVVAKSKTLALHDHGWNWNISEKNGFYSPFNIKGP